MLTDVGETIQDLRAFGRDLERQYGLR